MMSAKACQQHCLMFRWKECGHIGCRQVLTETMELCNVGVQQIEFRCQLGQFLGALTKDRTRLFAALLTSTDRLSNSAKEAAIPIASMVYTDKSEVMFRLS